MKLKKLQLKLERKYIQIYKMVNRGWFNNRFNLYLKHLGVNVLGNPSFISDDIWVDEVAPEFITIKDRVVISKGVTLLIHDYSANPLFETGDYLFGRGASTASDRNRNWSVYWC